MTYLRTLLVGCLLIGCLPGAAWAQGATDPYYEFLMARRLEDEGNGAGAMAALMRAAAADPKSADIRGEVAALYLRQNELASAEREAKAALVLDGSNVEANRVLGLIEAAQVDDDGKGADDASHVRDAIGYLEKATRGSQGLPDVNLYYTLGRLYLRAGTPGKAVQALLKVVAQNSESLQARLSLAQAQAASKDLPGAISTLSEILPDEPRVAALLGQYQEQAGRPADAAASYTTALGQQPGNRELKVRRIVALIGAKQFQQAATFSGAAQKDHPDDPRFPRLEASAAFAAGDRAGAVQVLEKAVQAFPKDVSTQLALVSMYNTVGRATDAERTLRQILVVDPSNADALNFLGYLLANRGEQLDEAIDLVTRALARDPDNGSYLDSLGWAHFRRGDMAEAERYLTAAATRLPQNSEIQSHLGDFEATRQRWSEAIAAWTRALQGDREDIDAAAIEQKISNAKTKLQHAK